MSPKMRRPPKPSRTAWAAPRSAKLEHLVGIELAVSQVGLALGRERERAALDRTGEVEAPGAERGLQLGGARAVRDVEAALSP